MRRTLTILFPLLFVASAALAQQGYIVTVAGNGEYGYGPEGILATNSMLTGAPDVAFDSAGNMFFSDVGSCRIRRVDASTGIVTNIAGPPTVLCGTAGDGSAATSSSVRLQGPWGLAFDVAGNLFFTQYGFHSIRRIASGADGLITGAPDEIISTVVGTGVFGYNGDNQPATTAKLWSPFGIAFDSAGNLFIGDSDNYRIRRVSPGADGVITGAADELITTVAGTGVSAYNGDARPATTATVGVFGKVAFDAEGNMFLGDGLHHRVRRVSAGADGLITGAADEIITTVAGVGGSVYNGDNIPALSANVGFPEGGVVFDSAGNLFVAAQSQRRVRKISPGADGLITGAPDEIITTVAGAGSNAFNGDNIPATTANIYLVYGLAIHLGDLYIPATGQSRVRKVNGVAVFQPDHDTDSSPPEIICTPPDSSSWYGADVIVNCTASDAGSGLANSQDASFTLTTSVAPGSETDAAETNTRTVCDLTGNCATAGPFTFMVDKKAPSMSGQRTPDANAFGWNNTNVTVRFVCADGGSGLSAGSPPADTLLSAEAAGQSVSATCTDAVGNAASATVSGINIDKTAPSVSGSPSRAADSHGWFNHALSVAWSGSDSLSGVETCSAASVYSGPDSGAATVSGSCTDQAGNTGVGSASFPYDGTPPVITLATPANGGLYVLNTVVAASYGCVDALSGTASCTGTVASGANVNTSSVGAMAFNVSATDVAGNSATASRNYNVIYAAGGACHGGVGHQILQPINADGTSVFKQKSTVPAKFRVCDAAGNSIGTTGVVSSFFLVQTLSGTVVSAVNEPVDSTTPDTTFRWSATDQQWIFNINTKLMSAHVTYVFRITLSDGSTIDFRFGLK